MANARGQAEWPRVSPASQARSRSLPVRISARGHALPTELEWIGTTPAHPTLSQLSLHTAPRSHCSPRDVLLTFAARSPHVLLTFSSRSPPGNKAFSEF